jgi:PAS domain S-box-containing protein
MAVLDVFHSCVPAGTAFVWLHSLAVFTGGVFFSLVWFPEREVEQRGTWVAAWAVLLATTIAATLSVAFSESLPAMRLQDDFTPLARLLNILGGGLTILAGLNFGINYAKKKKLDDLLFLLMCLFFGISGVLFDLSIVWGLDWWLWHLLRLSAYLFAFGLALMGYRRSENETVSANADLENFFHTAIDGKRTIDADFNHLQVNETFLKIAGINREAASKLKCFEAFNGPFCHTRDCPVAHFKSGARDWSQREVTNTRADGKQVACVLNALCLQNPDGSFRGIVESFWDITDRKAAETELARQNTQKTGQAELADLMRGELSLETLCRNIISFLCKHLAVQTGILYLPDEHGALKLVASYAHKRRKHLASRFMPGEGLVGQAALEKQDIILTNVPADYISVESGLGESVPRNIYVKPIIHNTRVAAVIELGTLDAFTDAQSDFLGLVGESIAVALESGKNRIELAQSLEASERLSEELQSQQEELKASNEELEEQTQRLSESEARLKTQQEELQVTNEELEEKNELLDRQKRDVEAARVEITEKAEELALASKYKSEFLANMSHELRTPLNSLLLLAKSLSDNKSGNLTDDQEQSAKVIYQGGNELLSLINEILDLSKIEAGRMDMRLEPVELSELAASTRTAFQHLAQSKGLSFSVSVEDSAPPSITTDRKRVQQVIKNLVANAIKFTERGAVKVVFGPVGQKSKLPNHLDARAAVAIAIEDTGIGIAKEQQKVIFEAFQQGDGSTARKYGGTGLGLSIARELARILGGEIQLVSEPDKGSTFTILLPINEPSQITAARRLKPRPLVAAELLGVPNAAWVPSVPDDRDQLQKNDRAILIIEDDIRFAEILAGQCREKGFKVLAAATGEEGVDLACRFFPQGILLDLKLPGIDGWRVLELLKEDPSTRHIPVHVASIEEPSAKAMRKGAIGYLQKPVSVDQIAVALKKLDDTVRKKSKRVLIVEDNEDTRKGVVELIADDDVTVDEVAGGSQAIEALRSNQYDCMILDLGLRDFDGDELLKRIDRDGTITVPPVIVYTARNLTWEEELDLRFYSDSVVVKGVRSDERLLDEVSLFLHRVVAEMPEKKRQVITNLHDTDALLRGKKVLLVDDDMRTLFALTKILADRGMQIFKSENGEKALALLEQQLDVDVILMDIMMPVLDVYETTKRIRAQKRFSKTPIIALTAKAMKGDKERCIEAGASDYLPKPVDQERLISMLRVWLYR